MLDVLYSECLGKERHRDDRHQEKRSHKECTDRIHIAEQSKREDVFSSTAVEPMPESCEAKSCERHCRRCHGSRGADRYLRHHAESDIECGKSYYSDQYSRR